jgi:hypothetical protein
MFEFRAAILQKINETTKLLLMLCEVSDINQLPTIPYNTTIDDVNEKRINYSFVDDCRNDYYEKELKKHINNTKVGIGNNGNINEVEVNTFKKHTRSFLENLLCLVHISGGQPARGSEITILQYKNNNTTPRNIYLHGELICILTSYHKGMLQTDETKDIYRFLPKQIGDLLIYYIWLVLPYYQQLVGMYERKNYRSTYLFTDDIVSVSKSQSTWDSARFSSILQRFFLSSIGTKIKLSDYRHIAIAIARYYLMDDISAKDTEEIVSDDEDDDDNDDDERLHFNNIWDL